LCMYVYTHILSVTCVLQTGWGFVFRRFDQCAGGHLEEVKVLLEVRGRELVMLARDDGVSCLYISAQREHLEVVKVLLEAGGCELVMLTAVVNFDRGISCLWKSAERGHLELVKALLEVGGRELVMLTKHNGAS